jgi:hypothetical protein
VVQRPHCGFPLVYFLHKDVEDALLERLVKDVVQGQITTLRTEECTASERLAIRHFITCATVRQDIIEQVRRMFPDNTTARQTLHLLRGFIVHRILLLTLNKCGTCSMDYTQTESRLLFLIMQKASRLTRQNGVTLMWLFCLPFLLSISVALIGTSYGRVWSTF